MVCYNEPHICNGCIECTWGEAHFKSSMSESGISMEKQTYSSFEVLESTSSGLKLTSFSGQENQLPVLSIVYLQVFSIVFLCSVLLYLELCYVMKLVPIFHPFQDRTTCPRHNLDIGLTSSFLIFHQVAWTWKNQSFIHIQLAQYLLDMGNSVKKLQRKQRKA